VTHLECFKSNKRAFPVEQPFTGKPIFGSLQALVFAAISVVLAYSATARSAVEITPDIYVHTADQATEKSAQAVLKMDEKSFLRYQFARAERMHDPRIEDWPYYATVRAPHKILVVEDGLAALELRLHLIEGAKERIDYMTFETKMDTTGRLLAKALMDRARAGVKVRLLLDWHLNGAFAGAFVGIEKILTAQGVPLENFQVRYYNMGSIVTDPIRMNHRNHAKLLVVDGEELVMGGRNSDNDYFQISGSPLKFVDREIWVRSQSTEPRSSIPLQAHAAFDGYWNDKKWVMQLPANVESDSHSLDQVLTPVVRGLDLLWRQAISKRNADSFKDEHFTKVNELTFVIDRPGHDVTDRRVTPVVHWRLAQTDGAVVIENFTAPFLESKYGILGYLSEKRNVPITILTNNVYTANNPTLVSLSGKTDRKVLSNFKNVWIFYMSGKLLDGLKEIRLEDDKGVYGTHAKSTVLFGSRSTATMIGSYNFDGRSESINNESLLIVENNPHVAFEVASSIRNRALQGYPVTVDEAGNSWVYGEAPMKLKNTRTPLEAAAYLTGLGNFLLLQY
jgi:putative cardiolipin synthase